ncbi:MAG: glycerol-3-phosphate 1-O-acyltransferase PlsY [Oscillospiraceae bacterium]|nr:glycerol-3-phosphate 1-O-acyltransferase PlsY [Oscillospiraceae bacterium]
MMVLYLTLIALIAYFLGGINGSIIASKYIFRRDIRDFGSGNPGLTNFYRTFGKAGVTLVLAVDILKSVFALVAGGLLFGITGHELIGKLFAGFCLILGHMYPVYYKFRGGKGVLCSGVVVLMMDWRVGIICWLVFAAVVLITRYVSLASMLAVLCAPIGMISFYGWLEFVLALFSALAVLLKHKDNIMRLYSGAEAKFGIKTEGKT